MRQLQLKWVLIGLFVAMPLSAQAKTPVAPGSEAEAEAAQLAQQLTHDLEIIVGYQQGQGDRASCVAAQNQVELAAILYRSNPAYFEMINNTMTRMRDAVVPGASPDNALVCPLVKPEPHK